MEFLFPFPTWANFPASPKIANPSFSHPPSIIFEISEPKTVVVQKLASNAAAGVFGTLYTKILLFLLILINFTKSISR